MTKKRTKPFDFKPFSLKQKKLLSWWLPHSPYADYDTIIADGSIRSGKTVAGITSFLTWSLSQFEDESFIIAGKSMGALKRNVLKPAFQILTAQGILYRYNRSENFVEVGSNTYYCFGANNEASQDVLQGLTSAGAYADEVALFPQSFVEQMIGRCSIDGSKVFMNCNPGGPYHYLKTDYIDKADQKQILRLHFNLNDNLALPPKVRERYKRMFSGVFYDRYVLGLWKMAEGLVYDMFDEGYHVVSDLPKMRRYWVGIDYGTTNPTAFILLGEGADDCLYVVSEWGWDSREKGRQKTNSEYSKDYQKWITADPRWVFYDPSAVSFGLQLRRDGIRGVAPANNDVLDGIRSVASLFQMGKLKIHRSCEYLIKELYSYAWDTKAQERGEDKPLKVSDHYCDALRYIINGTKSIWRKWMVDIVGRKAA